MIPKIIHLCWFSNEPYPIIIQKCINSWKKEVPDYSIKRWTMDMAQSLNIGFINQALDQEKWAFAADVVRLYALYTEGGVYMDSDFYLLKTFEPFLTNKVVSFHEYYPGIQNIDKIDETGKVKNPNDFIDGFGIQAAFIAAEKENEFIHRLLEYYKNIDFKLEERKDSYILIAPQIYAKIAEQFGFRYIDKKQDLTNDITIYESKYISQTKYDKKKDAFAIHCCEHSWFYTKEEFKMRDTDWHRKKILHLFLGKKASLYFYKLYLKFSHKRGNLMFGK